MKRELWAAMSQLMSQDAASFVRHGLTQITQGSYDEELAQRMMERVPSNCMHEDACAAFPDARRVIADRPPSADEGLARALRGFCDEIG